MNIPKHLLLDDSPLIEGVRFEEPPSMEFVEGDILENELYGYSSVVRGVNGKFVLEHLHELGDDIEIVVRKVREWFHEGFITSEDQVEVTATN